MKTSRQSVFSLVDIIIVVAILALLTAIAVPGFMRERAVKQKNVCVANLQRIEAAKANFVLAHKKDRVYVVMPTDIYGPYNYIPQKLICPAGGVYTIGMAVVEPTCSFPRHALTK